MYENEMQLVIHESYDVSLHVWGYFCSEFSTVSYVFNVHLPCLFRKCTTQCIYNDWKVELLINTEATPATFTTQRSRTLDNKIVILFIFRFHTHHILSFGLNKAKILG